MSRFTRYLLLTGMLAFAGCASSPEKDEMKQPNEVVGDATEPTDEMKTRIGTAEMESMPTWLVGCWTRSDTEKLYAECWKREGDELVGTIHQMDRGTQEVEIVETRTVKLANDQVELSRQPTSASNPTIFRGINEEGERITLEAPTGETTAALGYEVDEEGQLATTETEDTAQPDGQMIYEWEPVSSLTPVEALETTAEMEATNGLSVYSDTEAPIFIDGQPTGKTAPATLEVPAGEYDVSIKCPNKAERLPQKKVAVDTTSRIGMRFRCRGTPREVSPATP